MGQCLASVTLSWNGIFGFLRTAGPSLSPFNAWVILKGMETLKIRMEAHSANALEVARWLEAQPGVARVYYPGLPSHPQYELAKRQQKTGGGIVSFELKNGKEAAWRVVDSVRLISITANLGDTKSTLTHPATPPMPVSARRAGMLQESPMVCCASPWAGSGQGYQGRSGQGAEPGINPG